MVTNDVTLFHLGREYQCYCQNIALAALFSLNNLQSVNGTRMYVAPLFLQSELLKVIFY